MCYNKIANRTILTIRKLRRNTVDSRNICKFVSPKDQGQLVTTHFIYERNTPYMNKTGVLPTHTLHLVCNGSGVFCINGNRFPISVGTVFFSFADIPFSFEAGQNLEFYYIRFHGSRSEELFRRFGITPASCIFEGCEGLLPYWQDNIIRANDENADLLSESILYYSFSKLKKNTQSGSDLVAFVLSYLDEHFTDSALSLAEIADAAGYHKKYLSSTFKKQFGVGLSEYLRILRIRYAVMLIENGVTSVKNVAALSGFSDPLYFSKVFTDMIGTSPSQYQKNTKQQDAK